MSSFYEDVLALMVKFFGKDTAKIMRTAYDEDRPRELLQVARDMLSEVLGPKNVGTYLVPIMKKYHIRG